MPVISSNNAADAALNYLNRNSSQESEQISQLASGSRIIRASDDAAGLAIGTQLRANAGQFQQDQVNLQQGTSIIQTADGGMAQVGNILERMLALATEAASGQVTDIQRSQDIDTEYQQLRNEILSIAGSTSYANRSAYTDSLAFVVGTQSTATITISLATVNIFGSGSGASLIGSLGASVATASAALTAIAGANKALAVEGAFRAVYGAYESRFNFANQVVASDIQNISAAASVIEDADVAAVKTQLSATSVMTQAAVASLTQATQLPAELLKLIQA